MYKEKNYVTYHLTLKKLPLLSLFYFFTGIFLFLCTFYFLYRIVYKELHKPLLHKELYKELYKPLLLKESALPYCFCETFVSLVYS